MRSANLNMVALVIHENAATHVPVQYIQAYIYTGLTCTIGAYTQDEDARDWGLYYIAKHVNIPVPYVP